MATNIETENVVTRFITEYDEASGRRAARQAERITGNIGGGFDKTARSAKGSFDKIERDSRKSLKGVEGNFKKTESRVSTLFKNFGTKLAAIGIGAAIGQTINKAIGAAGNFESLSQSFEILTRDADVARALIEELNEFSVSTPFEPEQINQAAKTLLGFGRNALEVTEDLKILGNASAATGTDLQSLSRIYGKIAGTGRAQAEDLNQFIDNDLPIFAVLQESLGLSVQAIRQLATDGKLTFDIVKKGFEDASKEGGLFEDALLKQSKTFRGLASTFRGLITDSLRRIGDVFLPAAKETLVTLNALVRGFSDFIARNTDRIRSSFNSIKTSVSNILKPIVTSFKALFESIGGGGKVLTVVSTRFKAIASRLQLISNVAGTIIDFFTLLVKRFKSVNEEQGFFTRLFAKYVEIILDIPSYLNGALEATKTFLNNSEQYFDLYYAKGRRSLLNFGNILGQNTKRIKDLDAEIKNLESGLSGESLLDAAFRGFAENKVLGVSFDLGELEKELSELEIPDVDVDVDFDGSKIKKATDKFKGSFDADIANEETLKLLREQENLRVKSIESQIRLNNDLTNNVIKTEEEKAEAVRKNSINQLLYQREILKINQELLTINGGTRLEFKENQQAISEIEKTVVGLRKVVEVAELVEKKKDITKDLVKPQENLGLFDSILRDLFPEGDLNTIKSDLNTLYGELINLASVFSQERERILDNELDAAETRVNDILNLNKNASQEQLNFERARLEKAAKARERFSKRSAAAAKIDAAANLVAALAKIANESSLASFATLPAFLTLFAGLASASAQIFHEGTESVSDKKGNRAPSDRLRSNEVFAVLEKKERVMTVKQNAALAGMSNEDVVKYATIGKKIGSAKINGNVLQIFSDNTGQQRELKKMTNAIISMERTIKNMNIESKQSIDANGVSQMVSAGMKKVEKQLKRIR